MKQYSKDKFHFLNDNGTKKEPKDLEHYHNTEYHFSWKFPFIEKTITIYQLFHNTWYEIDPFMLCIKNSKLTLFPRKFREDLYNTLTKEENKESLINEISLFPLHFCFEDHRGKINDLNDLEFVKNVLSIHNLEELEKVKNELKILQRFDKLNSI